MWQLRCCRMQIRERRRAQSCHVHYKGLGGRNLGLNPSVKPPAQRECSLFSQRKKEEKTRCSVREPMYFLFFVFIFFAMCLFMTQM